MVTELSSSVAVVVCIVDVVRSVVALIFVVVASVVVVAVISGCQKFLNYKKTIDKNASQRNSK